MANFDVADTAVNLGKGPMLIQNLGTGDIFVGGSDPEVDSDTGLRVSAGESISVGYKEHGYWAVSSGSSDVRTLGGASGVFPIIMPS